MKRMVCLMLTLTMVASSMVTAFAADDAEVIIASEEVIEEETVEEAEDEAVVDLSDEELVVETVSDEEIETEIVEEESLISDEEVVAEEEIISEDIQEEINEELSLTGDAEVAEENVLANSVVLKNPYTADYTAPTVKSVSFSTKKIDLNSSKRKIEVVADFRDDVSGVSDTATIRFGNHATNDLTDQDVYFRLSRIKKYDGDGKPVYYSDKKWHATTIVPATRAAGEYVVNWVHVSDKAGNELSVYDAKNIPALKNVKLTFTKKSADISPKITAFNYSTSSVNINYGSKKTVTLTAKISNSKGKIKSAKVLLSSKTPGGGYANADLKATGKKDEYKGQIVFTNNSEYSAGTKMELYVNLITVISTKGTATDLKGSDIPSSIRSKKLTIAKKSSGKTIAKPNNIPAITAISITSKDLTINKKKDNSVEFEVKTKVGSGYKVSSVVLELSNGKNTYYAYAYNVGSSKSKCTVNFDQYASSGTYKIIRATVYSIGSKPTDSRSVHYAKTFPKITYGNNYQYKKLNDALSNIKITVKAK